ncbi:hypothetical protein RB2150_18367 [Rhodobacterales bacterium HTCC2150]|nr:hypothetical protein RB2150_18367 [Rhodobacterales bacterium HTCC2150] [Rhodobacteraceae bacterium HTCC2150]
MTPNNQIVPLHENENNKQNTAVHAQQRIQIANDTVMVMGSGLLFRHANPGGYMWNDQGDREFEVFIPFETTLERKPLVQVNLSGVDASHAQNLRLTLAVKSTSLEGFVVGAKTWGDTKIASVDISWMAMAQSVVSRVAELVPLHFEQETDD